MDCKIITTTVLATTCIKLLNYHFLSVVRTLKIFLSNFQVCNIVSLSIVTRMYIVTLKNANFNHANIQNKMVCDIKIKGIL